METTGQEEGLSFEQLVVVRRKETALPLEQLILPDDVRSGLDGIIEAWQQREFVRKEWKLAAYVRGEGFGVLLHGPSGLGKTAAAHAVANKLGMDLAVVSLPAVISSYQGETVRNLETVLAGAEKQKLALLFDEADSVASQRNGGGNGGAADVTHRQSVAHLLQRMDGYNGLVFFTTNLTIDPAFNRRMQLILRFEKLPLEQRMLVWQGLCVNTLVPIDFDGDESAIRELAAHDLSPGDITVAYYRAALAEAARSAKAQEASAPDEECDACLTVDKLLHSIDQQFAGSGHMMTSQRRAS